MIKPWRGFVTDHIKLPSDKSKIDLSGYSLTRPISAVPQRKPF